MPLGGALAGAAGAARARPCSARAGRSAQIAALGLLGIGLAEMLRRDLDARARSRRRRPRPRRPAAADALRARRTPVLRKLALCSMVFSAVQVCLTSYVVSFLSSDLALGPGRRRHRLGGRAGGRHRRSDRCGARRRSSGRDARAMLVGLAWSMALCGLVLAAARAPARRPAGCSRCWSATARRRSAGTASSSRRSPGWCRTQRRRRDLGLPVLHLLRRRHRAAAVRRAVEPGRVAGACLCLAGASPGRDDRVDASRRRASAIVMRPMRSAAHWAHALGRTAQRRADARHGPPTCPTKAQRTMVQTVRQIGEKRFRERSAPPSISAASGPPADAFGCVLLQPIQHHVARRGLRSGCTASSRSMHTRSAPAATALAKRLRLLAGDEQHRAGLMGKVFMRDGHSRSLRLQI